MTCNNDLQISLLEDWNNDLQISLLSFRQIFQKVQNPLCFGVEYLTCSSVCSIQHGRTAAHYYIIACCSNPLLSKVGEVLQHTHTFTSSCNARASIKIVTLSNGVFGCLLVSRPLSISLPLLGFLLQPTITRHLR